LSSHVRKRPVALVWSQARDARKATAPAKICAELVQIAPMSHRTGLASSIRRTKFFSPSCLPVNLSPIQVHRKVEGREAFLGPMTVLDCSHEAHRQNPVEMRIPTASAISRNRRRELAFTGCFAVR
jgi:hypothetical protein